jgi:hypothetical protein
MRENTSVAPKYTKEGGGGMEGVALDTVGGILDNTTKHLCKGNYNKYG